MISYILNKQNYFTSASQKMIFFCVAFFFLTLTSTQAQESFNISSTAQILATQLEVKAYPNGTFDADNAFLVLHKEMDKMTNDYSRGLQYRYYWLVSADVKRKGLPLEESLLKNLNKVGSEYGVSNSSLQKLYRKTISKL